MKVSKRRVGIVVILILSFFLFCRANAEVPVLMYHHVGHLDDATSVNVSTKTFERQMEFLKIHRYHVISLFEFLQLIRSGQPIPAKTVVITFDYGNLDNFQNAFPILKEMNFPATIFMITRNINGEDSLSEEDLRILDESGVSIGSHTVNHAFLPNLGAKETAFELAESKKRLEKVLGHPVVLLSYPAGGFTKQAKEMAARAGYEGAVTTNYGKKIHDPFAVHRVKITEDKGKLFAFWIKTSGWYHLGKKRIEVDGT